MKPKVAKPSPCVLHVCTFCNYSTDKSANLSRHNKTMHETVKDSIVCCGISFLNKAAYREHNKSSHASGHACPVCARKFSRRALLRRHLSVHTGYKEFKCGYCNYASSHKSNLSRHMKVHRNENPEQVIKLEPGYNNISSQPDSTTSPVLPTYHDLSDCRPQQEQQQHQQQQQQQQQYQHGNIIIRPYPILRSMLTPTFSSNSQEVPCESKKLSHSIESILSRGDPKPSSHDREYKVSCMDEMVTSTTTSLSQPLLLDEETTSTTITNDGMQVDTVWKIEPQAKDGISNLSHDAYWPQINSSPFVFYNNNTDSSFHKYNNYYYNNCFAGYDSSTSSVAGGYLSPACYSFDFLYPTIGLTTTNAGPGQDSRILPPFHSPYAVSSSTSCYQTFQPRVLVSNPSPPPQPPYSNNYYELSPPDSAHQSLF